MRVSLHTIKLLHDFPRLGSRAALLSASLVKDGDSVAPLPRLLVVLFDPAGFEAGPWDCAEHAHLESHLSAEIENHVHGCFFHDQDFSNPCKKGG